MHLDRKQIEERNAQEEAINKQLQAFVTIKRLNHMGAHFNAAISFLYPPAENRAVGRGENQEAAHAAERAAYGFLEEFFTLAKANVVDLRSGGASEAFEYETALENQPHANPQA